MAQIVYDWARMRRAFVCPKGLRPRRRISTKALASRRPKGLTPRHKVSPSQITSCRAAACYISIKAQIRDVSSFLRDNQHFCSFGYHP